MKKYTIFFIVGLVLILDQALKIWIKTHMYIGEEIKIFGNWSYIHFVENNGMAFGLEFGGVYGKIFLTVFRLSVAALIGYYLIQFQKRGASRVSLISGALLWAGAVGNIIDSVFYGVLFGYEKLFFGRVVDMFYFPLWEGYLPSWLPMWGGDYFVFFRPVFNIADAAISLGIALIILYQRSIFDGHELIPTPSPIDSKSMSIGDASQSKQTSNSSQEIA